MFLTGIGTATPSTRYTQPECWEALTTSAYLARLSSRSRAILKKVLLGKNGICSRFLAFDDLAQAFDLNPDVLDARFAKHAPAVASRAAERVAGRPTIEWKQATTLLSAADRDELRFEKRGGMLRNILTPAVPAIAGRHVETVLTDALARAHLKREDIGAWIFHAGGREILAAICQHVDLTEEDVRWSAEVLHDYGNVSSPCVYFVLQLALRDRAPEGYWWMSSFGAGFSCHGTLLHVTGL